MKHRFQVWSPHKKDIKVLIQNGKNEQSLPMEEDGLGNWTCTTEVSERCLYHFQIGRKKPIPDPCSHFQPEGIFGPSMLIDHGAYQWQNQSLEPVDFQAALIYEAHIGTFTSQGTFLSAIEKIPYLASLGVTHLELMPVSCFSGERGWGYDGVFPFSPHHTYGQPDDLKALVDACHEQRIAVIMDVIYNHFGPSGNFFGEFGPYHTDRYHTPWGQAINFDDAYSDAVRDMILNHVSMWLLDYRVDGLRLDAIHAIFDQSAMHILEEISRHVLKLDQMLQKKHVLIAESDLNDPKIIRDHEHYGYGYDAQWSDDFHHAMHTILTQESSGYYQDFGQLSQLTKALKKGFVYDGNYSQYRKRKHGRSLGNLSPRKLITYIQNHDQVGNRATGDRVHHDIDLDLFKAASCIHILSPSIPMIFQGEEWACSSPFIYFTSHQDAQLAKAVREGRIREFSDFSWKAEDIPDPQNAESFEKSKLLWGEQENDPHCKVLSWYRELIAIRKDYLNKPPFCWPEPDAIKADEELGLLMIEYPSIIIVANFSNQSNSINDWLDFRKTRVLSKSNNSVTISANTLHMNGYSAIVLHKEG